MLPLRQSARRLKLPLMISIIVLLVAIISYYTVSICNYSLPNTTHVIPTAQLPREKAGHIFASGADLRPETKRPLTFQSIEAFDLKTDENLEVDVYVYDEDAFAPSERCPIWSGFYTETEWWAMYADRVHPAENFKTCSQRMWIFPLFHQLPPHDHGGYRLVIKYKIYNIFPKQEELLFEYD